MPLFRAGTPPKSQKTHFLGPFWPKTGQNAKMALFFWVKGPGYAGPFISAGPRFPPSFGPFGPKTAEK